MSVTNRCKCLRAEEESIEQAHMYRIFSRNTGKVFYTNNKIYSSKNNIYCRIKGKNGHKELEAVHTQQRVVDADTLVERQPCFPKIIGAVGVYNAASFGIAVGSKTGIAYILLM